ncbi:MAG: ATP-binding cassette domain-containing protein [Spirochaetales bacterium]|nr:MAG: ATP-binding cassette domain-containing protein [Spirochaetales bacterium]
MIRFENAGIHFDGKPLLESFNLDIESGEKVLLVSPSGRGKTSILKALLGFVPLSSGRILYKDVPLEKHALWEFRKILSYVPQNTDLGEGSLRELLTQIWGLKAAGAKPPPMEELERLMKHFRLPGDILAKDFEKLSGGEKQRITFIIAAALNWPVVLLDEPVSSLDAESKKLVRDYISARKDWTVLAVSHDREWQETGSFRVVDLEPYQCSPR